MDKYFILNTYISGIFKSAFLLRHGPKEGNNIGPNLTFTNKNIFPLISCAKNNPIVSSNKKFMRRTIIFAFKWKWKYKILQNTTKFTKMIQNFCILRFSDCLCMPFIYYNKHSYHRGFSHIINRK